VAAGYAQDEPYEVGPADMDLLLRNHKEYAFVRRRPEFSSPLDLHWDVAWRWQRDGTATEDLWAEAKPKAFFGVPAYALSPEWEFLFLAAHASHHLKWRGLKWLVDIHEVCSRWELDWGKVGERASRLGWGEAVRLTLSACRALFDTPIPSDFSLRGLPRWLKLFPVDPSAPLQDVLFPVRLLRRPSEKLRYLSCAFLVPTIAERRLLCLPQSLGFFYYLLRPLRLLCKGGWWLLRAGFDRSWCARW
jgi:hypothetical protein